MAKLTVNEQALKQVKVSDTAIAWFQTQPHWHNNEWPESAGPKPTDKMFMAAAQFSTQGAGCESGFVALQMREGGCSIYQLGQAFNCGPAHNHSRDLKKAGYFEGSKVTAVGRANAFLLTFTEKGVADLYRRLGVTVKPAAVKPAAVVKAKAKVKAAKKAVSEAKVELTAAANATPEAPAVDAPQVDTSLPASSEALAALAEHFSK